MRIYPAIHYTMGGLWVDYNLMSNVPGLHVLGEANFSDHGANRLGASALMQGLADGYFVIPYTIGDYLASTPLPKVTTDHDAFKEAADNVQKRINQLLSVKGNRGIREIHRELGRIMWDDVGMARTEASLRRALTAIPKLREEFWQNVSVPGSPDNLNQSLEYAGRVADYLEFAELLALDALHRDANRAAATSAKRARRPKARRCATTRNFSYVAAWEFKGVGQPAGAAQGAARCSRKCIRRSGATSRLGLGSGSEHVAVAVSPNPSRPRGSMRLKLKIWRQTGPTAAGKLVDYAADHVSPDMSFLEMLDVVNEG